MEPEFWEACHLKGAPDRDKNTRVSFYFKTGMLEGNDGVLDKIRADAGPCNTNFKL